MKIATGQIVALYSVFYNFCRLHKTLGATPAATNPRGGSAAVLSKRCGRGRMA
jgi:hypothetical protein